MKNINHAIYFCLIHACSVSYFELPYCSDKNMINLIPWTSYQIRKIAGCTCAGNAGNVFLATVVSFDVGDGENVPGIPDARTTHNFTYLVRGPLHLTPCHWSFQAMIPWGYLNVRENVDITRTRKSAIQQFVYICISIHHHIFSIIYISFISRIKCLLVGVVLSLWVKK